MNTILTITQLTFHEARRRRMVLVALGLGAAFVALFAVGLYYINAELQERGAPQFAVTQAQNFLSVAGFYVVHFLTVMLAIFASVDTVSGEIYSHTIQTLVTKPVRRWQVLIGKWLGFALMIVLYLALLGGGMLLALRVLLGYTPPNPVPVLALLMLEALVLLSLSLLGGTRLSTLTNGVGLFMLYGLAFIGAWVEQIGALLQSTSAVRIGIVISLVMPVEALWRRAAYLMQSPFTANVPSPFSTFSAPSSAMVLYAACYAAVALALALRSFSTRDL